MGPGCGPRSNTRIDPCARNGGRILFRKGNGKFQKYVDYATGSDPQAMAVGDFNADGKLDLAVANYNNGNTGSASILLDAQG
jgi:hypothetical protein